MKLPGLQRLEVQSLGRRETDIGTKGHARVRAQIEKGDQEQMRGLEYRRGARKEDLRGAGADFDTGRQERAAIRSEFQSELASARALGDAFDGAARGMIGIAQFSQRNQLYKAERNGQEADLAMQEAYASFEKEFGGRDFIDPSELTGAVDTPANRARTSIPSAEVLPTMLEEHLNTHLASSGQLVENEYFRSKWNADAQRKVTAVMAKANITANAHYQNQVIQQQAGEYKGLIERGNIAEAYTYIDNMLLGDAEKNELRGQTRVAAEKHGYKNLIAESDEEGLHRALEGLMQPFEDYKDDGGKLGPDERLQYRNAVSAEISRIDADKKSSVSANHAILKQDISWTQDNLLNKGQVPTDVIVEDIRDRLKTQLAMDPSSESVRAEIIKFEAITQASGMIGNLNKMDPAESQRQIDSYREAAKNQDSGHEAIYHTKVADMLQSAHDSIVKNTSSDMIQAAVDYGQDVAPIEFTAEGFMPSLAQRKTDEKKMHSIYKQTQGLLSKHEANKIGTSLDSMPATERAAFYGGVFNALGPEDSVRFFDQVRTESGSTTSTIVGEMVSQTGGDVSRAVYTLKGQAYRSENKAEFTNLNKMMPLSIQDITGELYQHNPTRHAAIKEAVYDTYVGLALNAGEDFTAVDSDLLKQAVNISVGSIVKQGGMSLPSFNRTMDQNGFEDHVRRLPEGFFSQLGSIDNGQDGVMAEQDIRDQIIDGDISMRAVGGGSYMLWRDGAPMMRRHDSSRIPEYRAGGGFIFEYDKDIILTEDPERGRHGIPRNPAVDKYILGADGAN